MNTLEQIVTQHDQRLERLEDIASNQQGALRVMQTNFQNMQTTLQEVVALQQQTLALQHRQIELLEQLVVNTNGRQ